MFHVTFTYHTLDEHLYQVQMQSINVRVDCKPLGLSSKGVLGRGSLAHRGDHGNVYQIATSAKFIHNNKLLIDV